MTRLIYTPPPHLKAENTVSRSMLDVFLALVPVSLVAIYFYQAYALLMLAVCLATAAVTEVIFRALMKKPISLKDGSALLTGMFVALLFSPTTAWWTAAIATFLGVGIAKELMGGLGWNRFNPALFGYVVVFLLAPVVPFLNLDYTPWEVDVVSQATPLAMLHSGMEMPALWELVAGFPGAGAMAEVSPLALLLGAAYLFYRKHIGWHIPVTILATVFVLTLLGGENPFYHLFTGGLMLGAFFMATDWVTCPISDKGKLYFGIFIGVLVVLFRLGLPATEGVAFSILIMNAFVPMIDRLTKRPSFSDPKSSAAYAGTASSKG